MRTAKVSRIEILFLFINDKTQISVYFRFHSLRDYFVVRSVETRGYFKKVGSAQLIGLRSHGRGREMSRYRLPDVGKRDTRENKEIK